MRLIFLGPPGAGKGTQALKVAQHLQIPHISTGELLREAIAQQTDLGHQAQTYVETGELVPDDLIIAMMRERFGRTDTREGWILDGFPRNVLQAQALDRLLQILQQPYGQVIHFDVLTQELVKRMLARGRGDDTEETICRRLEVYQEQTAPLLKFYQKRRCLTVIDGNPPARKVALALFEALETSVPV